MGIEYKKENLIIFDGECIICDFFVQLILKNEKMTKYYFYDQFFLNDKGISGNVDIKRFQDTVILYDQDEKKYYFEGRAIQKILITLKFPYNILGKVLKYIPLSIVNYIYTIIAKNRSRFFKKKCNIDYRFSNERFNNSSKAVFLSIGN
ncbi:MAG: DCC1-like thiol-disulfide oxidoreductase family protein [Saprospiraceae bacterium]